MDAASQAAWNGPLAGVRVLDFTRVLAGPAASLALADLGAEVIKIEPPGSGDETRGFPPVRGGESHYFLAINRGKKSIVVDLKTPEGVALVKDLAAHCDIVVENYRPGVMDKLGRDRGLISYATLADYNRNMAIAAPSGAIVPAIARPAGGALNPAFVRTTWRSILRYRTALYFMVWALIGLAMLATLIGRSRLDLSVLHDRNPVFVQLSDGSIRNGFEVKILNMMPEPRTVRLSLDGLPGGVMTLPSTAKNPATELLLDVEPDKLRTVRVFVAADPAGLAPGRSEFEFIVQDVGGSERASRKANFETGK